MRWRKGSAMVNYHDYEVNELTKSVSNLNDTMCSVDAVDRVSIDLLDVEVDVVVVIGIHFINELLSIICYWCYSE